VPRTRKQLPIVVMLAVAFSAALASAETNRTPIAVPLLNTDPLNPQAGAPYPSQIMAFARGGPAEVGEVRVILHAVTHPCPEDLAVLLVHGSHRFLVMSNAGSCRPLQGTDMVFDETLPPLPDADVAVTPHGERILIGPSVYGVTPGFPAPAPAAPYIVGLPVATIIEGLWELYVMDKGPTNRGVIAGGWTLAFRTDVTASMSPAPPVAIPVGGPAASYPITFDLSAVPAGVTILDMSLNVQLAHDYPDDLRILLEPPVGAPVVVMANAGGSTAVSNVSLWFADYETNYVPNFGPLVAGGYKPFSAYETPITLPAPAPPGPYGTQFGAFTGQAARGLWRLWVYDDFPTLGGSINAARLFINTEPFPEISITAPTTAATYTAREPFLNLEATLNDVGGLPRNATWRNVVDGAFYDAGGLTFESDVHAVGRIPLRRGTNVVTVRLTNTLGQSDVDDIVVTVNEFTYYLSEGATGGFFDTDVTLANPTDVAAAVTMDVLPEHSAPVPYGAIVSPNVPLQLHIDDIADNDAVSTVVHSTNGIPLVVERTMSWDGTGYGGHGGTAISPNTRWLFAEGSQGFFDTYVLLANDNSTDVTVQVRFLLEGGGDVTHPVVVQAHKRVTVYAGDIPALVSQSFGIDVSAPQPIIAERAMYFPHGGLRPFEGGTESAGVNRTSTRWILAEGATGPFFECYVLLSNPTSAPVAASITYLLPSGERFTRNVTVPANGRSTINVEGEDPRLVNTPVSMEVTAGAGIIAERSMYWPDVSVGWREAHNSFGVTEAALRWGVADGRIGGPRGYQTYILLANPNTTPAEVHVSFLKGGVRGPAQTYILSPTSRQNVWVNTDFPSLGDGLFSAEIQVLNYQPIVVEKAMYWNSGTEIFAAGTGVVATPLPPR
jgi:subtilisin-like proprotein convertase family protein